MKKELVRYEVFLVLASFIWGTSFISVKIGVEHVDPFLFSIMRFLFGSIVLLAVLLLLKRFDTRLFKNKLLWGISLINAVALEFQHFGMTMTSATNAVLLVDIDVVFIALLAVVILAEKITNRIVTGLLLGMIGVVIITTNGDLSSVVSGSFVGNAMVFFGGVLWAFYVVYQKKVLVKESDVLMVTGVVILETTLFLLPMTFLFAGSYVVDNIGWLSVLYTGVFCTGLAFLLYNTGLKAISATIASVILLLEIVFAMLFAFIVLGETPTIVTAIGGALIIIAIIVISLNGNNESRSEEHLEGA
ncbi:MAG: EamA family transporter [Methanomassiliicoccales archaeon]|nr:EamA family transporter [Methanomassiliicoccales archaeon]